MASFYSETGIAAIDPYQSMELRNAKAAKNGPTTDENSVIAARISRGGMKGAGSSTAA